jgi:hypothetical protein
MRTEQEKQRQIEGLKMLKATLPEFSLFGNENWIAIDAKISMLMGLSSYEDFQDDFLYIETEANHCQEWLDKLHDEDLF